jgi:polysaccharide biosynthesis protein PslH
MDGDILFLAHRIPYPPDRGDKIRSWHMLKHLGGLARVHLACFADDEADAAHLPALRTAMGRGLGEAHVEVRYTGRLKAAAQALAAASPISLPLFSSAALQRFVSDLLASGRIGTIFAFSGQMAQFVPERAPQRFIMDFVDMDSAKFAAYAEEGRAPLSWLYRREAEKLFAFERATAARADVSLFVSEAEAALFRRKTDLPNADIRAMQNGVDLAFYDPLADFPKLAPVSGPLIAFTGQMDYPPNVEAVTLFARDVFPLVRKVRADARFAIVGRHPTDAVKRLGQVENIVVTGPVADIRTWLAIADVVVAPLRIARGVQNKVLEAMAMARPVVASSAAFEGIEAEPGRDLLVAEGAQSQAEAVLKLLEPPAAQKLGRAGRAQVEAAYRWEAQLAPLTDIVSGTRRRVAA